jgi:gliding motility-associated-like protein
MATRHFFTALFLLISFSGTAQLCQGSLGDPLVNITFGAGFNPGPSLAAAATGYQYVSGDCPSDGYYTVRSNTTNCFSSSWHSLSSDHTGNTNGYFMLVNASIQPSAFYIDTVRGLCGNSTYEFAAWIINVILPQSCNGNSNQPNLSFTIEKTDGTVLQTYNSGNIPPSSSPIWKQYGFFFTTPPAGSDIVLRIVNNAPGGCGNDLALDDITFRPCGPQLTPSITGQTSTTANICEGSAQSFNFNCFISAGFNNPVFQWQQRFNNGAWSDIPAATTTSLSVNFIPTNAIGQYDYRLSVAESGNMGSAPCRISSTPISVIVNAKPVATASNNGPVCNGSKLTLTGGGGSLYTWIGPNSFSASGASVDINTIQLAQAGTYSVLVTSAAGCSNSASTIITVNPSPVAGTTFTDTSICVKGKVSLLASGGGTYQWLPTTGLSSSTIFNPIASPDSTTQYLVLVSNAFGCTDTAFVNVKVYSQAIANAGPDKTIILGGTATLSGTVLGSYQSFFWSPITDMNNPLILQPLVKPSADAMYVLTVQSNNGCGTTTDTVLVKLFKGIFIPNAFTPNNDGKNDTWNIPALDAYPNFELWVFNRYGEVVFKNSHLNKAWDGSYKANPLPTGAYPYLIKLNVANQILKGTVMIIH